MSVHRAAPLGAALALAFVSPAVVHAQTVTQLVVRVHDDAQRPVPGARIRIDGPGGPRTVVAGASGAVTIAVAPGIYRVAVSAAGRVAPTPREVTVVDGASASLDVVLAAAPALPEIGRVQSASAASRITTTVSTSRSLDAALAVDVRQNADLRDYVYAIPGLHYFQSGKSNVAHVKVRGADNEPRTELDGHPLTNTGAGNFLIGWLNADAFDRIDVEQGPGIEQGDEGRTAFGTVNLISHEFADAPSTDLTLGVDDRYGSQAHVLTRGATAGKRLRWLFDYAYAGRPDPAHGVNALFVGPSKSSANANATQAVAQYAGDLGGGLGLREQTAKLQYAFSPVTSLTAGFIGFQGRAAPLGGSYAGYEGQYTIVPCFTAGKPVTVAAQCGASSVATAPSLARYVGTTQNLYSGYTGGSEVNDEPYFEAALRTSVGRGVLTVSPFTGIVSDIQTYAAPATAVAGLPTAKFTRDVMHGTTVAYVQPLPAGYVKLNYEYRSDATTVYTGAPFTNATLTTPTTTLRENDVSLTSQLRVAPKLSLGVGVFSSASRYDAFVQSPAALAAGATSAATPFASNVVRFTHLDPHVGLVYTSGADTSWRVAAGSAVYGPGSTLISGRASYTAPAPANANQGLIANVNPALRPEVTVAFEAGVDRRLRDGTIVSATVYDDSVHDKFLAYTFQGGPLQTPSGTVTPLVTQTVNAALQRNYGLELGIRRDRAAGLAYDVSLSLNRQFYSELPANYFRFATAPISPFAGYQGTTNPYSTAHAELRYVTRDGTRFALGSDTVGADNVQRAPGYTTAYASVRRPVSRNAAVTLSVENLFDYQTAAGISGVGPAGSGASTITAAPSNGTLVYAQTLASVLQVAPRVVRLSLTTHIGR